MIEHVLELTLESNKTPSLVGSKKATLWTPWGSQRVPDLDKALSATKTRSLRNETTDRREDSPCL